MIQERAPLTIPSTRRNPVLADVFNMLGYMGRKGSGFEKIISGYEFQINYDVSKRPSFRADRYQFTVVMPNLNYDVPQDVTQVSLKMSPKMSLKMFGDAIETSANNRPICIPVAARELTDTAEIIKLMEKRKKANVVKG